MRKKRKLRARTGGAEGADEPGEGASASELDVDEAAGDEPGGDEAAELESDAELDPDAELEADPELDPDAGLEPVQAGEVDGDADVSGGADDGELGGDPDAELSPAFSLDPDRLKSILESLLFAAEKPLSPVDLRRLTGCDDTAAIQAALDRLMQEYEQRGVALYDVAGGYQFRTHPANSEYVQRLIAGRPVRLSRAQLETLAIIAYRQPVTRPEIDEIRGVDSGSTLKVLIDRSLIRVLGKKEEPGRPLLYGTSKEFLEFFNLRELRDLPSLREFSELTEESLREVEALDQAGKEEAGDEAGAAAGSNGAGDDGDDDADDDSSSAAATH